MYIFPLLLTTVTLLGGSALVKADIDAGKTPPMEEWVNPGDMINYDTDSKVREREARHQIGRVGISVKTDCGSLQAELLQCEQDLKKMPSSCPSCAEKTAANASPSQPCDTPYFKKLARTILGHIEDYGSYEVTVTASKDDSSTLEKFVSSDKGNVQDVSEVIIGILTNFKSHEDCCSKCDISILSYLTGEAILLSVAVILVICAVVIFEMRTNLSWRSQLWLVLLVSFIVSIPWEWYRLYRKAFASKQAQMARANEIPKGCLPDHELHPWESFKLWFSSSFTFSDDICTRYQETLLVDPFWEVSPSKVSSFVFYSVQQLCFAGSYFERGCRIKCMQQYQKVLWFTILQRDLKEWHERPWTCVCKF
ncbi:unnamed protein product [Porites evermanni]|uniref:Chloride channel CLIC-like protein 1 n=1 Tax=Porites evermanni TaxID=104178 RepID=A0ABN8QLR6_9CNID|nr:unnamed protein product [Porites evermanni]